MEYITGKEMQARDRRAIETYKIPEACLMEVAGFEIFQELKEMEGPFLILAGSGNNGGDGFVLARHLFITGKKVAVLLMGKKEKMKPSTQDNFESLVALGVPILGEEALPEAFEEAKVLVDALFGTGLSRPIEGRYRALIEKINESPLPTVAVDIPSGLEASAGEVLGIAVKADLTITMHRAKTGFKGNEPYTGKVLVKYIGIPEK